MLIKVKVFPHSKKEEFIIKNENSFEIKIKEKPIEGKANDAVVEKLAVHFNISSKKIRIIKGGRTRNKIIEIYEQY